jgi:uncharacterized membrane protein YeaQ/YmgE (transglycosylase-associated protein family)
MTILAWIVFGLIVGIITHLIDPVKSQGGIFGTILLGIVGALVGGLLANVTLGLSVTGFNFQSFMIAVLGSLLVLFAQRSFGRG